MTGFFDPTERTPEWIEFASSIETRDVFAKDIWTLLPYISDDFDKQARVDWSRFEKYYIAAINDGITELAPRLLKLLMWKLQKNVPLGADLTDYLGCALHEIVVTTGEHRASYGFGLRRKGKGRRKSSQDRHRWSVLAIHLYGMYLISSEDKSITSREADAEADFKKEAQRRRMAMAHNDSFSEMEELEIRELQFVIDSNDLLATAKRQWSFAEEIWGRLHGPGSPDPQTAQDSIHLLGSMLVTFDTRNHAAIFGSYLRHATGAQFA